MSRTIFERGNLTVTECASVCDVCGIASRAAQLTGPHGYVTVCYECVVRLKGALAGTAMRILLQRLGP
jgi:hypothetical protein